MREPGHNVNAQQTAQPTPVKPQPNPPILAAHGFSGDITSFNKRVQTVWDAYRAKNGKDPSPGLVFDVARSPHVIDNHIPTLFDVPPDPRKAIMRKAAQDAYNHGETFSPRPDGLVDRDNWYKNAVPKITHPTGADYPTYKSFYLASAGKYQMIPMGFIPHVPSAIGGYQNAWKYAAETANPQNIAQYGKITPEEADKIIKQVNLARSSIITPYDKASDADPKLRDYAKGVKYFSQVQKVLKQQSPVFKDLPADGYMTPGWIRAYSSWSRSNDYGFKSLQQLAVENHFKPTAKDIAVMNDAYKTKVKLLADPKNVYAYWFLQSVPLRAIANMDWSRGIPHNPIQLLKNAWSYSDNNVTKLPVARQLHEAFNALGLGVNLASGVWNEAKSQDLALNSLIAHSVIDGVHGHDMTRDEAAQLIASKLKENPTWAKIISLGYLTDSNESHWGKLLDEGSNMAVDMILGTKISSIKFNAIPLDSLRASKSIAVKSSSRLAFNAIKKDDFRQAVRDLHETAGAEKLVAATAKRIQNGDMPWSEFHQHVSELYGDMRTTVGRKRIDGHVLTDYSSNKMRNMGVSGFAARSVIRGIQGVTDSVERGLLKAPVVGTSTAEKVVRGLRQQFSTATPKGAKEIFAPRTPHNLYNFLTTNGVVSRDKARTLTNKFIVARSRNSVPGMQHVLEQAHDLFRAKYPLKPGEVEPSIFEPLLETEGLGRFNFPVKHGIPEEKGSPGAVVNPLETMGVPTQVSEAAFNTAVAAKTALKEPFKATEEAITSLNKFANDLNHYWRTVILAKNAGRFYKHAVRDTLAARGGGAFSTDLEHVLNDARSEAYNYMSEYPEAFRHFSTSRGRTTMSEMHWLSGDYWVDGQNAWNMKDFYGPEVSGAVKKQRLTGAAAYVRNMLTSDAYTAWQRSSKANMEPLVDAILRQPGLKNRFWHSMEIQNKFREKLKDLQEQGIAVSNSADEGKQLALNLNPDDFFTNSGDLTASKKVMKELEVDRAREFAAKIFDRFEALDKVAQESGTSLDSMWTILHNKPGLADKDLAAHLKQYQVPVHVHDGVMVINSRWDAATERLISTWMKPNFWARGKLYDHTFAAMFHDFKQAGAETSVAIEAAAHGAERLTMKHMLDFQNQLQFEQNLRWLYPFFTKHRLYTGWLVSSARQYPYLPLPLNEINDRLDENGNVSFNIHGVPLRLNALRLMWLNSQDLPATIPITEFIPGLKDKFSGGPWLGGTGEAVKASMKILTGVNTYEGMLAHQDEAGQRQLHRLAIIFGIKWQMHHPDVPVPEGAAVRYALGHYAESAFVNDTMFVPFQYAPSTDYPSNIQKKYDMYQKLAKTDPGKAADYLNKNPEAGLVIGVYKDPKVYWHLQAMFGKLRELNEHRTELEKPLIDQVMRGQELSLDQLQHLRQISKDHSNAYKQLLLEDALSWQEKNVEGFPPGRVKQGVNGKEVEVHGPFGAGAGMSDGVQKFEDWLQGTFPNMKTSELVKMWGQDQQTMQDMLNILGPNVIKDPHDLRKFRAALNQNLDPYRDLPKDEGGQLTQAYFNARESWYQNVQELKNRLSTTSGAAKQEVEDEIRLLEADSMVKSSFSYHGKTLKGPAFAITSYYNVPKAERVTWFLTNLVNASYENLSSSDKTILGLKNTDPKMDAAWVLYHEKLRAYQAGVKGAYGSTVQNYKSFYASEVNKIVPGFMKDWVNTRKPKYELVSQYKPLEQSHYYGEWKALLGVAQYVDSVKTAGSTSTVKSDYWEIHVLPGLINAMRNEPLGFREELQAAGGEKFLRSLISRSNQ